MIHRKNILLIGSGGREHAIAAQLVESPLCNNLYVAPGNPGTADIAQNVELNIANPQAVIEFVKANQIDLTFVGPEQPLADGLVDEFEKEDLTIVGPNKEAAQLESSKAWAKAIYKKYHIPTAEYAECHSMDESLAYVKEKNQFPIVIKADGLAAGKGVTIAHSFEDAKQALEDCFINNVFKEAGDCVVIEEFLHGEEASLFAFTDGQHIIPMVSAQDHKAIFDEDKGPNTGGMGAYSPAPVFTKDVKQKVMDRILKPLVNGFNNDGIVYKGILYAGLMINPQGDPYVVEFNIRFGDPETQIVLPKLKTDLVSIFTAIANETLADIEVEWDDTFTVCVVLASNGYPGSYKKGALISGLDIKPQEHTWVFQAGTTADADGRYITNGGRVLNVCSRASTLDAAIKLAYQHIDSISFDNMYYRKDIGQKGLTRLTNQVCP